MKIIFRADGNSSTGLGHIMRSAALMQMISGEFTCEFWTRNPDFFPLKDFTSTPSLRKLNDAISMEEEAEALRNDLNGDCMMVVDGYQFITSYQQQIKSSGAKLACIDDIMSYHFVSDVVINHAGGIQLSDYSAEHYTKFCLGPQYALVKPVFNQHSQWKRDFENRNILVALGGADPKNDTAFVLQQLAKKSFNRINVVLGAANLYFDDIQDKYSSDSRIVLHRNLTAEQMCALMCDCPYAVLSPSTICYEYMTIGGMVYLHQIADNQERIKQYFLKEQLAFAFGRDIDLSVDEKMLSNQQRVFDGKSPQRFLQLFKELAHS
jgi:UDP-2,4-diacetamido-2,4,6-trideoxy-beta-L-altropyranose hydrolase